MKHFVLHHHTLHHSHIYHNTDLISLYKCFRSLWLEHHIISQRYLTNHYFHFQVLQHMLNTFGIAFVHKKNKTPNNYLYFFPRMLQY